MLQCSPPRLVPPACSGRCCQGAPLKQQNNCTLLSFAGPERFPVPGSGPLTPSAPRLREPVRPSAPYAAGSSSPKPGLSAGPGSHCISMLLRTRPRRRAWTGEPRGGRGGWGELAEQHREAHATVCATARWWGTAAYTGRRSALCGNREVGGARAQQGGARGKGRVCSSQFTLVYTRNQHNIVKQLFPN